MTIDLSSLFRSIVSFRSIAHVLSILLSGAGDTAEPQDGRSERRVVRWQVPLLPMGRVPLNLHQSTSICQPPLCGTHNHTQVTQVIAPEYSL